MDFQLHPLFKTALSSNDLLDENGHIKCDNPEKVIRVANDIITSKAEKFRTVLEELEKLKIILDTNPCTISWVKSDLTYEGVNKTLADVCLMNVEDFPGKIVGFHTHNKHFFNFTKLLFESRESRVYQEIETNLEGDKHSYWVVGTKYHNDEKALIIGIDVTELRNLEENVTFMEKLSALGEMVASIVHEINNPLMSINMQSTKVLNHLKKDQVDRIPEAMDKIQNTTEKIANIIRGVKTFVRHGDTDPFVDVALKEIIDDAILICEGKLKDSSVKLQIEIGSDEIHGNVTQLFQVFVNLITNSIDAMEDLPEKWIRIESRQENGKTRVVFTDAGTGIPKEIQDKIFKSFFTTKAAGKGTGLGLSLCKKIMQDHGGDLRIDDQAANTTFILDFN